MSRRIQTAAWLLQGDCFNQVGNALKSGKHVDGLLVNRLAIDSCEQPNRVRLTHRDGMHTQATNKRQATNSLCTPIFVFVASLNHAGTIAWQQSPSVNEHLGPALFLLLLKIYLR